MEKLLRILFVMCAFTFITTVTACRTTDLLGITEPNPEPIDGNDNTPPDTDPDTDQQQVVELESFIMTLPTATAGITVDDTADADVVKVTIKPSLLTYVAGTHRAPIFTITFQRNKQKGFIIPTIADKAANTHIRMNRLRADVSTIAEDDILCEETVAKTYGYLTDTDTPGFDLIANNPCWLKASMALSEDHISDNQAYLVCETTVTGINDKSFATLAPAVDDDLAIGDDTKTECFLNLEMPSDRNTEAMKTESRKKWAAKVVQLDKLDPAKNKNLQPVNFFGIVTGDHKASAIAKVAPTLVESEEAVSSADITELIKAYTTFFQKVKIVIEEAN